MSLVARQRSRLLFAAAVRHPALLALLEREPFLAWDALASSSFAQARFLLQHQACDLLLVHAELVEAEGCQGLAWLLGQRDTPVLFLGEDRPEAYARAYELGVHATLPMSLALAHPPLLHAAMQHAITTWEDKKGHRRVKEQLADSRRHVDRLVQMIWRMTPRHDDQWYSQRHMLERLDEELARCRRHAVPLSLAVAELEAPDGAAPTEFQEWLTEVVLRGKRRCDVVGQYGVNGFLLLMVHTPMPGGLTCCRRLQQFLEHPPQNVPGPRKALRSFFGVASAVGDAETPQGLLRTAEENLEAAREEMEPAIVAN